MSARGRPRDLIRTALSAAALAARQGSVTALTAARFHSRATHERRQRRRLRACEVAEAGARALRERRPLRPAGEAEAEQARVVVHAEASMGV